MCANLFMESREPSANNPETSLKHRTVARLLSKQLPHQHEYVIDKAVTAILSCDRKITLTASDRSSHPIAASYCRRSISLDDMRHSATRNGLKYSCSFARQRKLRKHRPNSADDSWFDELVRCESEWTGENDCPPSIFHCDDELETGAERKLLFLASNASPTNSKFASFDRTSCDIKTSDDSTGQEKPKQGNALSAEPNNQDVERKASSGHLFQSYLKRRDVHSGSSNRKPSSDIDVIFRRLRSSMMTSRRVMATTASVDWQQCEVSADNDAFVCHQYRKLELKDRRTVLGDASGDGRLFQNLSTPAFFEFDRLHKLAHSMQSTATQSRFETEDVKSSAISPSHSFDCSSPESAEVLHLFGNNDAIIPNCTVPSGCHLLSLANEKDSLNSSTSSIVAAVVTEQADSCSNNFRREPCRRLDSGLDTLTSSRVGPITETCYQPHDNDAETQGVSSLDGPAMESNCHDIDVLLCNVGDETGYLTIQTFAADMDSEASCAGNDWSCSSPSVTGETDSQYQAILTKQKLHYRTMEDLKTLLADFSNQVCKVSEQLVQLLHERHDLQQQIEMRYVAVEQLSLWQRHDDVTTQTTDKILSRSGVISMSPTLQDDAFFLGHRMVRSFH